MCIRDSLWIESQLRRQAGVGDVENPVELLLGTARVIAVSYTHLRAHETVLDLVCRLLLEKKKITRQLTISIVPQNNLQ